jgi:tetratricopeptide (TPR) repeat protein
MNLRRAISLTIAAATLILLLPRLIATVQLNVAYLELLHILSTNRPLRTHALPDDISRRDINPQSIRQAMGLAELAIQTDPRLASSADFVLGHLYYLMDEPDRAEEKWLASIRSGGTRVVASAISLGQMYFQQDRPELARQRLGYTVQNVRNFFIGLGDHHLRNFFGEKALQHFDFAKRLGSPSPDLEMRIALAAIMANEDDVVQQQVNVLLKSLTVEAFADWVAYLHATVTDNFVWLLIAASDELQRSQQLDEAEFMLLRARSAQPDPISYSRLGAFYCSNGQFQQGIATLNLSKIYGAEHYAMESRQMLSICYCRMGLRDAALHEATDLANMAPVGSSFRVWADVLQKDWSGICHAGSGQ